MTKVQSAQKDKSSKKCLQGRCTLSTIVWRTQKKHKIIHETTGGWEGNAAIENITLHHQDG